MPFKKKIVAHTQPTMVDPAHASQAEQVQAVSRPTRVPFSGPRDVLSVPGLDNDNFMYRFINDTKGRISRAIEGGYSFCTDVPSIGVPSAETAHKSAPSGAVSIRVGQDEAGKSMHAYLMRIPKEFYIEDQEAKQEAINNKEEALYRGFVNNRAGGYGNITTGGKRY